MHRDEQGRRQFRDDDSYRGSEGRSRFEERDDYRGRGYEMSGRDSEQERFNQERYGRYDQDRYGRNSDAWNRNVMQGAYGEDSRYYQERWSPSEGRSGSSGGGYGNEMSRRYESPNYGMNSRMGQGARDWYGSGESYGSGAFRDSDRFSPYRNYGPNQYGQGGQQMGQGMYGPQMGQGMYGQQMGQGYGQQQTGQGMYGQGQGMYGQRDFGSNYNPMGQGYSVASGGYMQPSDNSNYASGGGYNQGRYSGYGDQSRFMGSSGESSRAGSFGSGYGTQGRNMRSQSKGPKGYKRSDDRIREDICDRLSMQDIDSSEIEVSVSNGEVTLSGSVSDRSMKYDAEQICDAVQGVNEINNQLRIKRMSESTASTSSPYGSSNDGETATRSTTRTASQGRS